MPGSSALVLRAVYGSVWAIDPDKLEAMLAFLDLREQGVRFSAAEVAARIGDRQRTPAAGTGGVAVLPLFGLVSHRAHLVEDSSGPGGTSTEKFGQQFDALMADDSVETIVLDVDSPGGSVNGVPELAARIAAARGQKPVIAVANALMASAAYWIGSAASELVVTPSGEVGSIGVYGIHTDRSRMEANAGITRTIIKAGPHKAEGSPYEPLSSDARAFQQQQIDEYYDAFVGAVAQARGVSTARVRDGYGGGRVLTARQALAAGMVDRVATLDQVLAELGVSSTAAAKGRASGRRAAVASPALDPERDALDADDPAFAAADLTTTESHAADADEAAPAVAALTLEDTALQAEEIPVAADNTAAPPNGAHPAAGDPAPGSADHFEALTALAETHGRSLADVRAWQRAGRSVTSVREELLAGYARTAHPVIDVGADRATTQPFASFEDFLQSVRGAGAPGASMDPRLQPLAGTPSGMNQNVPSEGGFTVTPQFSTQIWDEIGNDDQDLLGMTDQYTVTGESLTFNANGETSRGNGSRFGGVQGYWIAEADQITKSKPKFRQLKLEPQGLAVLVYLTDKLIRNSGAALEQFVTRAAAEEISFMSGDAILNGSGAGQPLGIMNSGCLITVAKEAGQANGTVLQENVSKMWARLHPRARKSAVWLLNVDVEPQLDTLNSVVKNVAGTENVGGYANKVFDAEKRTIKGRPIVTSEFAQSLGTKGDIVLAGMNYYAAGVRGTGVETAVSMHVRFEFKEQAFRFYYELDGQPWLADPLTPYKGANTLSSFVTLAAR